MHEHSGSEGKIVMLLHLKAVDIRAFVDRLY
jgi:hypothetical protein